MAIKPPNATIGIRGTGAYIEVHEGRTYFCLCYGKAEVGGKGFPAQGLQHAAPRKPGVARMIAAAT